MADRPSNNDWWLASDGKCPARHATISLVIDHKDRHTRFRGVRCGSHLIPNTFHSVAGPCRRSSGASDLYIGTRRRGKAIGAGIEVEVQRSVGKEVVHPACKDEVLG